MASLALGVKFSPASSGTGDFVYSSTVTGYRSPTAALVNGKTYRYRAENATLTEWEFGYGTWNSSTSTLARTTVSFSSTGSKVSFTAAPVVGIVLYPDDVLQFDDAMSLTPTQQTQGRTNLGILGTPREVLTANRTYYVRTDGSDSNTGLANTAGGAFLTIQKAIDTAVALDLGIYSVTINVADGTYTGAVVLKAYVGVGPIYITGNTGTPSNVVISTTGASAIAGDSCGRWTIGGVKVQTATAGYGVYIQGGTSIVTLDKVDFGVVGGLYSHILAAIGATINVAGNYTISGDSGDSHYYAIENGVINVGSVTVTLSGAPTYLRFALAYLGGMILSTAAFSGAGSGVRYLAIKNSSFEVYGAGANYFPGTSAGSADATSSYS